MFNLGGGEILVVLLLALLLLGPDKLPEAARRFGEAMSEFRKISNSFKSEMYSAMNEPTDASSAAAPTTTTTTTATTVDEATTTTATEVTQTAALESELPSAGESVTTDSSAEGSGTDA